MIFRTIRVNHLQAGFFIFHIIFLYLSGVEMKLF